MASIYFQIVKSHFTLLIAVSWLFLAGCASTRQFVPFPTQAKAVEDSAKGRIYVLRPATALGAGISMAVTDGGTTIGITGPDGFLCWERPPGHTIISSMAENTSDVNLSVTAGQVHYIFQHVRFGHLFARNKMEIVSEEKGRKILKQCKPPKL